MQKYDKSVDGLIVCGSPSYQSGAKIALSLAKIIKIFRGDHHRSKFINKLAFGSHNQKSAALARQNGNPNHASRHYPRENSWIVSDPAVVEAYGADARDGFVFTLNGFIVLFSLMIKAYNKHGWRMQNPSAPIFFIAGADDPCIINQKSFEKAVNFLRSRGYHDIKSRLYPHMRHEILNEIGKTQVWHDIVDWMTKTP